MSAIPSRESAATKGRRLLAEGRVAVLLVHRGRVNAEVRGDSGLTYRCRRDPHGWSCTCPAKRDTCSHLVALRLILDLTRLNDRQEP